MTLNIFLVLLISGLTACQSMSHQNMLNFTADYNGDHHAERTIGQLSGNILGPKRVEAKITNIFVYPHEMDNGDYFMGGWVKTVISKPYWDNTRKTFKKKKKKRKK